MWSCTFRFKSAFSKIAIFLNLINQLTFLALTKNEECTNLCAAEVYESFNKFGAFLYLWNLQPVAPAEHDTIDRGNLILCPG